MVDNARFAAFMLLHIALYKRKYLGVFEGLSFGLEVLFIILIFISITAYLNFLIKDPLKYFPLRICLLILALAAYEDLLAQWVQSHWLATGLLMSIFWVCYHFMTKEIENLKSVYAGAPLKKIGD